MATIALIAKASHREYDGVRILLLVTALMTAYNPDQVLFNTSFHMSFLATLGVLTITPRLEQKLKFIPERYEIRGIVATTLAAQILLLPYLAHAIGEVSMVSILSNIIILPIIPLAMLSGAVLSGVALILPPLAEALSPLAYLPLRAVTLIAETLAHVPYAVVPLPEIGGMGVLARSTTKKIMQTTNPRTKAQQRRWLQKC